MRGAFLVIKSMGAEENPEHFERLTELCADPRISLRDVKLDREELLGLIKSCDAFVSLHRSEGFGRGPAEAMLLGRPTILTAYSGTNDFATTECAYLVDYELVPVHPSEYLGVEGQKWADANVVTAAHYMRVIYERPEEAREIGERGKVEVARLFSPSVVGRRMCDALMELLDRSDPCPT
jgi:glycosyltransferase involved in cell wall biosynthesis